MVTYSCRKVVESPIAIARDSNISRTRGTLAHQRRLNILRKSGGEALDFKSGSPEDDAMEAAEEDMWIPEKDTRGEGKCILVIEDDALVRALLREMLELEGYRVYETASGREATAILRKERVDLITLDLNLGGEDGLALARGIRATRGVPIIMITAKAAEIDRVVGLELGADDYIIKPFCVREVLARVRAVLRRSEASVSKDLLSPKQR